MVVAVSKAVEEGATAIICASTGNTSASAAAYARCGRDRGGRRAAARPDRARQAAAGPRRRGARRRDRRQLRPGAGDRPGARRAGRQPGHAGQLGQPASHRGTADRRVRGLRRPRARAGRPRDPRRQRGQHQRVLGGVPRLRVRRPHRLAAPDVGVPGRGCRAARHGATGGPSGDGRHRDPDRRSRFAARRRWPRATSPAASSRR